MRLALFVLAYNLGSFMRRFALPKRGVTLVAFEHTTQTHKDWSQDYQSLQDDRIPDGRGRGIRKAVPVDAIENPSPWQGMRESTCLSL